MIERIRDYEIRSLLGEGGMGMVYLADEPMLERQVAIKALNPELTKDRLFVDRFRQEAKVQSTLVHPGIVSLYTFFQDAGTYCMVMEYAVGETLTQLIDRIGPVPEERARHILLQILAAVGYAHAKGVIHRDIKPSNIMVGRRDSVKVMDFGIARIIGDRGMTKTGTKMGTLYYMSPEQVLAKKDIDERTDIYSIGMTLYEILAGRLPFDMEMESDFHVMQTIVEQEFSDPRQFYPMISDIMVMGIRCAIAKERENRFSSCEEWRAFLEDGKGGRRLRHDEMIKPEPAVKAEPILSRRWITDDDSSGDVIAVPSDRLIRGVLSGLHIGTLFFGWFQEQSGWKRVVYLKNLDGFSYLIISGSVVSAFLFQMRKRTSVPPYVALMLCGFFLMWMATAGSNQASPLPAFWCFIILSIGMALYDLLLSKFPGATKSTDGTVDAGQL
jgi:tRNA A-37 threonylcarbamoyl transferase component Bud32